MLSKVDGVAIKHRKKMELRFWKFISFINHWGHNHVIFFGYEIHYEYKYPNKIISAFEITIFNFGILISFRQKQIRIIEHKGLIKDIIEESIPVTPIDIIKIYENKMKSFLTK